MNIHNINIIARYEVKLLRRSWLFRVFALLTLLILTFVELANLTPTFWKYMETWYTSGVTSMLPFYTIYLYNIAQSVIVIFLAGSFLKRDKKLDTAEVIYVRPMSNADYIIGKVWGIVRVFISLNAIMLLITAFFNLVINQSPFSIFPYIFYLLTISLPSLLFILGLSFTMMCLLKNQAVTFIVMLGIVGTVFFYLQEDLYGLFDFFGVNIPAIFSDVTGHANLGLFLLQRSVYMLMAIGLICFTITLVKRLPHRPWKTVLLNIVGAFLVLSGGCAGLLYTLHFKNISNVRNSYISAYDKYESAEKVNMVSNDITITQQNGQLQAESRIKVINKNRQEVKELVLYLNPALKITSAESDGVTLTFSRDQQVIVINKPLPSDSTLTFTLKYDGTINENVCYADIEEKDFLANPFSSTAFKYRYGKRYAYVSNKFTLLTPECLWYPVTIPPVNPKVPYAIGRNFTAYSLTVTCPEDKTVVSQGQMSREGDKTTFKNKTLLPGISLTIADYEKKSITVDDTDYELYYFKGHDFFTKYFDQIADTLPAVIRDIRNDLEIAKNKRYPFRKFVMAETPITFAGYTRNWKGYTEAVMPEIVFIPERGMNTRSDFRAATHRTKDWRNTPDELMEDKDVQTSMLKEYFKNTFVTESDPAMRRNESPEVNKLNIGTMFFGFTCFISSEKYPVIDVAVNTMLNTTTENRMRMFFGGNAIDDGQKANLYLADKSFKAATEDRVIKPQVFYEMLKLKSNQLKNFITAQVPVEEFKVFMNEFYGTHPFEEIPANEFIRLFNERFGIDLEIFLNEWYHTAKTPTIVLRNVDANKVQVEDFTKYQIRFKVYNASDIDAVITVKTEDAGNGGGRGGFSMVRMGGGSRNTTDNSKNYIIPGKTAREVKIINDERPARLVVNTNISHNLPNEFTFSFSKIDNEISDSTSGIFQIDTSFFAPNPYEIIVDNEDPGFRTIEANTKHRLKDLFKTEEEDKYKGFRPWRFPSKWTAVINNTCYGTSVNSAVHKAKGKGGNQVEWSVTIPKATYYEVAVWNPKFETWGRGRRGNNRERTQTYVVKYDQEEETVTIDLGPEENGWVPLGNFYLPEGKVTVSLSDKVSGDFVVADAVKFTATGN